ncbi:MAG: D-alanine--D-alanine ligase [Chloroflexi bacterium]|nr:D-alanine--D-alanine ligase [Chloroflexota bacterium]
MARKIRVGVLFGGQSSEHEVSIASARSVISAMDPEKYEIVPIGITRSGIWLSSGDPMSRLRAGVEADSMPRLASMLAHDPTGEAAAEVVQLTPRSSDSTELSVEVGKPVDVIFPVLHGPYGEDGTVQGALELAGIPYVGSGVLGSAVSMDKDLMKQLFIARGIPVTPYICVSRAEWRRDPEKVQQDAENRLSYPIFAKPSNMGSSVGISKIHGPEEFSPAVNLAARYDRRLIIEQGLQNAHECECAVLGNDYPEASVVGEVVPGNEFYDYRAKYVDDNSAIIIPAGLPSAICERVRQIAIEAFKAVDAAGMARVDFFVARDMSGVWINEINTIPGFTRISMYPKLWEASGLPFPKLIDRLIELALERQVDRIMNKSALEEEGGDLPV